MVPRKVPKLLATVGHENVYKFLEVDSEASLDDLNAAAEKKRTSLHNQSARTDASRAGVELAGLCKARIFNSARSKRAYDKTLAARDAKEAKQRDIEEAKLRNLESAAKKTVTAATSVVFRGVAKHAERISAGGIILMALGLLTAAFSASAGESILTLGVVVFSGGLTAFLYKQSLQFVTVSVAVGIGMVLLGIIAEGVSNRSLFAFRLLGGMVLLSGIFSFVLKKSWHLKILGTARPIAAWWMAKTSTWNPLRRFGVSCLMIGLVIGIPTNFIAVILFGEETGIATFFISLTALFIYGGIFIIAMPFLWWLLRKIGRLLVRGGDVLQCQSCGATMSRDRYKEFKQGWAWRCPQCGTDIPPVRIR